MSKSSLFGSRLVVCMTLLLVMMTGSAGWTGLGARPVSMGGAFTALADDANATYYNPAGLVNLESSSMTYTQSQYDWGNTSVQQNYAGFAMPMGSRSALGISWSRWDGEDWATPQELDTYWISLATKLTDKISIGMNYKTRSRGADGYSIDPTFDLALHGKINDRWSAGLMVYNIDQPSAYRDGVPAGGLTRTWQPGAAYRQDESSVWVLDFMVLDKYGKQAHWSSSLGYERILSNGWIARAGYREFHHSIGGDGEFSLGVSKSMSGYMGNSGDVNVSVVMSDTTRVLAGVSYGF